MKFELAKEEPGNIAFSVAWVSLYGDITTLKFDTLDDAELQVKHLIALGYSPRNICIRQRINIVEELEDEKQKKETLD